jgi:AcrR family transcriptional regulator
MDAQRCAINFMTRNYQLKRRAESQAETRQRIVEATVDLHTSVGPARTTVSAIAERAGVQRHTVYAHFPDERDLFEACSGHVHARDPLPDAQAWRAINDPDALLRHGLTEVYQWFARNAELANSVLRDAQVHQLARETAERAFGPPMSAFIAVPAERIGASPQQRAALALAFSYFTWRSLVHDGGLSVAQAADMMTRLVLHA